MVPQLLKDLMLSFEGTGYAGRVDVTQMPKLTRKMEEYQAGGMSGPVEIDLGSEKLEMEFEAHEIDKTMLKNYGKTGVNSLGFRLNGSIERDDDACTTSALEILCRGRIREIDTGGFKAGDKHTTKYAVALSAIKLNIDDENIIEIDNANYIFKVGGVDLLEKRRKAMKL